MIPITDILGWIGSFVSICFFASPAMQFYNLLKKKIKYTDIQIIIILANYISSIVWLIYGFAINLKQIKVCYSIGTLLSLIWIWTYLINMGKTKFTRAMIFTMLLSVISFLIYIILTVIITDKKVVGEICFIVCCISYIYPIQLIIKVINSKNYNFIPIYSIVISSIGYGSWALFGLFHFNANIIIPNLVGLTFSLVLLILYRVYKNKTPLTEELKIISHTVMGAMKNVVDKTVEIANSIKPNGEITQTKDNSNIEQNLNTKEITSKTNVHESSSTNNNVNDVIIRQNENDNNIKKN